MNLLNEYLELAQRAHHNISFSPEKRGQSYIDEYGQELNEDIAKLEKLGQETGWYIEKYKRLFSAWMHTKSNCISSMITGPANFPVARAEKHNRWEENKQKEFYNWREQIFTKIERRVKKEKQAAMIEQAGGAANLQKEILQTMEGDRAKYKLINKAHAAFVKKGLPALESFELTEKEQQLIINYVTRYSWEPHPIAPYTFTNLGARIRKARERLTEIEKKEALKAEGEKKVHSFEGGTVTVNHEADRLQIVHNEIPEKEVRVRLKKGGFNWSRFYGCWQRKITSNALYSLRFLVSDGVLPGLDYNKF